MTQAWNKAFFTVAALFNWVVGAVIILDPALLMNMFSVTPLPEQSSLIRLGGLLVLFYGTGYYWAAGDLRANAQVIRLGAWAKMGVFSLGVTEVMLGNISWQFLILVSADLAFALLFLRALGDLASKNSSILN